MSKLAVKSRCKIRKTKSIIQIRKGKRGAPVSFRVRRIFFPADGEDDASGDIYLECDRGKEGKGNLSGAF